MHIRHSVHGTVVVVRFSGQIMGDEPMSLFRGVVEEYLDAGRRRFVLDLCDVPWVNSQGLGGLVRVRNAIVNRGGRLALANITDKIEELLIITRLTANFETFDSLNEALVVMVA